MKNLNEVIIINIGGKALVNGIVLISDYKKAIGTIDENGDIKVEVKDEYLICFGY